jgi:hypothetical protein
MRNQNKAKEGQSLNLPPIKSKLRELNCKYKRLAAPNIAEEEIP